MSVATTPRASSVDDDTPPSRRAIPSTKPHALAWHFGCWAHVVMKDVRHTLLAVFTLFAMLILAKCEPSKSLSFHPERANAPPLASMDTR